MKESDPKFYFRPSDALHLTEINVTTEDDQFCSHRFKFSTGSQKILDIHMNYRKASEGTAENFQHASEKLEIIFVFATPF